MNIGNEMSYICYRYFPDKKNIAETEEISRRTSQKQKKFQEEHHRNRRKIDTTWKKTLYINHVHSIVWYNMLTTKWRG
jgi:hypothetical protein